METMIPRSFAPSAQSYFIFGPRGVGKTLWLKTHYKDALRLDMLQADVFRAYAAKPERLIEVVEGNPDKKVVVIDEIQKLPELLDVVHHLLEEKIGRKFILTGSSPRKLKRTKADLLAGRLLKRLLYPFIASELGDRFALAPALKHGLVPLVFSSENPEETLKSYVALYIQEEVQAEGLVRNIGNFSRFLEAASFSHAALLNVSNVARECAVERKVVENYISILEDLLLAYRLPVFAKRAGRAVVAHQKFYFFDAGVFRTLRPAGHLDRPEEIEGQALEGLVAQHLVAWNSYGGGDNRLYFWRTQAGSEVDFVVYGRNVFWAIEVKNTARVRSGDIASLKSFKSDYPQCETFFLYRGKEKIKAGGVLCLPVEDFLRGLIPGKSKIY